MPQGRKSLFDPKSQDFSRKHLTDLKFWKRLSSEREELETLIAQKLRKYMYDVSEEIKTLTSYKDQSLLKSLELELQNVNDRAEVAERSANAYKQFSNHLDKEISADLIDPHFAEELSSYKQALKSLDKAEKDILTRKEKIARKEKKLIKLMNSNDVDKDDKRKHLEEELRKGRRQHQRNIDVKEAISQSVYKISDYTLTAWKDWEETKIAYLLSEWKSCISLQSNRRNENVILNTIDQISLHEMVDKLAELKMKDITTEYGDVACGQESNAIMDEQLQHAESNIPTSCGNDTKEDSALSKETQQNILQQNDTLSKLEKLKRSGVTAEPEISSVTTEETTVTAIDPFSPDSDSDSSSLSITPVIRKTKSVQNHNNKTRTFKSNFVPFIKKQDSIEEIECQEKMQIRRTPKGHSPKKFLKDPESENNQSDQTDNCENDPWSLFIFKSDSASNDIEMTPVQEFKSTPDYHEVSGQQQHSSKQLKEQNLFSRRSYFQKDDNQVHCREQQKNKDTRKSYSVGDQSHKTEEEQQPNWQQRQQRSQSSSIQTEHKHQWNPSNKTQTDQQQPTPSNWVQTEQKQRTSSNWVETEQRQRTPSNWVQIEQQQRIPSNRTRTEQPKHHQQYQEIAPSCDICELVVIKDYYKRSNKELSLKIGQKVIQLCAPDSKGMAYGYKKKIIPNSKRGYFPISCVIPETKR